MSACWISQSHADGLNFIDSFFGAGKLNSGTMLIRTPSEADVVVDTSSVQQGELAAFASDYRLGPGDRIKITVFNEVDLSMEVRLSDAGSFLYPFLGEVVVKGMTISDLQSKMTVSLSDGYLKDPKVYVSILEYRPFFVNGEVKSPGAYPYQPGLTVRKAIALSGGVTQRASLNKIYIIHESDVAGTPKLTSLNNMLLPGDIITVDQSFF